MNNLLYIGFFLFSVLLVNWTAGIKATFWYLLIVFLGVILVNTGKYKININTPEILR
jgi:hypothetical protein